jgi:hypothetical protein
METNFTLAIAERQTKLEQLEAESERLSKLIKELQEKIEQRNQAIYSDLRNKIPDQTIMGKYNISKQRLAARKAWLTIRNDW